MTALGRWLVAGVSLGLILGTGTSLGLATAWLAVSGEPPFGRVRSGPWTTWPGAAGLDADPYARAVGARDGHIPLGPGAGVRFLASQDSEGHPLLSGCRYTVAGPTAPAQAWTLTLLDAGGFVPARPAGRPGFTSSELVRALDGGFVVTVAAQAQPGNWLPVPGDGRFTLMLNFYDTPLGTALLMGGAAPALPSIVKERCA